MSAVTWFACVSGLAFAAGAAIVGPLSVATKPANFVEQTIESRIDGDFDGWEGTTIFTLENGQIWQQTQPGAKYYFARRPKVTVSGGSYLLKIDGMAAEVRVRRIK